MRLIVLQDDAMVAEVLCGREAIYIGSREACRVHLPDARVAPEQAVIHPEGVDQWVIEQLDARSELRVNGSLVTGKQPLRTGDEIQLYAFLIRTFPAVEDTGPRPETGVSRAQFERFAQSKLPGSATVKRADEAVALHPGQLQRIGQLNVSVSQCIAIEELMDIALHGLLETFAAHRAWVGVRRVNYGPMEYVEGRLLTGQPTDLTEFGNTLKPRVLDRAQFMVVPVISADDRNSVLAGPLNGPEGPLGMVYLDTADTGRKFDARDLDFFMAYCTVLATQLDAVFKYIARNRAATIDGQVLVAHEIQARLTPRKLPQWEQLQIGAFREPGRQRTGDIYDVMKMPNNLAAFMVAHTSATGALPSMLMAQAQAAFRSAVIHQDGPHVFLRSLNWLLYDGLKDHPLNCFASVIDPATGQMRYSLAGHTGAYVIGLRGEERRLSGESETPPLGTVKAATCPLLAEQIEPSETLVLFTPGVTTATNRKEETFGEERFVNILCDGFGQLASTMLKEMLQDVRHFTEGGSQPDDITVILAHRV